MISVDELISQRDAVVSDKATLTYIARRASQAVIAAAASRRGSITGPSMTYDMHERSPVTCESTIVHSSILTRKPKLMENEPERRSQEPCSLISTGRRRY